MTAGNTSIVSGLVHSPVRTLLGIVRSSRGYFRGVFNTYEAAETAIPKTRLAGYDHAAASRIYLKSMSTARFSDYPAMFWIEKLLVAHKSVFDYGGNVGVSYYKFGNYIEYPQDLCWRVCDLPEITKAGEEIARERNIPLLFTTEFALADGVEVFFSSGSIQYVQKPLANSLQELRKKPKHILLNRVPLYEGRPFVTLDDIGPVVCAYQVYNREQFISSICDLNYDLVDSWFTLDWGCNIRWHPSYSFPAHSGLYFRARSDQH